MALSDDLALVAVAAASFAADGEELAGVLAAEPSPGLRTYLCAFAGPEERRSWIVLDGDGQPLASRDRVRAAVSIAAMCELAEENAGGGELEDLRAQLVTLRMTESPEGIDEAEEAALALERALGAPPRLASPDYLDTVGAATRRLERVLGQTGDSPFAVAMQQGLPVVVELAKDVESSYKVALA